MGRAGLSGGCRPLRNPTLTTYYYARTSGGSPKRRHEPPMDAAGDGPVEDAGEDSRPGRAEVGGPRLQRGAQAEVRTMPLRRPQRHSDYFIINTVDNKIIKARWPVLRGTPFL